MATKIGDAFFDVDADTSKADKSIAGWAKSAVGSIGKVGLLIGGGLVAGTVAGLAGLEKVGSMFDDATDDILVRTGATGKELAGLEDSFKNVFTSVPVSSGDAADAIGDLNKILGLTGDPLEDLATQFLNLGRITGTDLSANVDKVSKVFNQFGIAGEDQTKTLDGLFRLSQETGVSVDSLADSLLNGGVAFRAAGLTFEQSAGLLGQLNKAGLDAGDIVPALSKAMAQAAKDGKSADEVFRSTFEGIKNAATDTDAAGLALDVFGAKAGPKLAALIREGVISLDDLTGAFAEGQTGINDTAAATDDWREKLTLLKNKALAGLAPVAEKVFGGITSLVEKATPVIEDFVGFFKSGFSGDFLEEGSGLEVFANRLGLAFRNVVDWFKKNWPTIREVALKVLEAVGTAVAWVYEEVLPRLVKAVQATVDWVRDHWPQIKETVTNVIDAVVAAVQWFTEHVLPKIISASQAIWAFVQQVWPQVRQTIVDAVELVQATIEKVVAAVTWIWENFGSQIKAGVEAVWGFIQTYIQAALDVIQGIINTVLGLITGDWGRAWDGIKQFLGGIWDQMKNIVNLALDGLKLVLETVLKLLGMLWEQAWKGMQAALEAIWQGILTFIGNIPGWITAALSALPGLLVQLGRDLLQGLWNGAQAVWDLLKGWLDSVPGLITDVFAAAITLLFDVGMDIVQGLWNGIKATWELLFNWVINVPTWIKDQLWALKDVLYDIGKAIMQGLWNGMKDVWNSVTSWLSGLNPANWKGPKARDEKMLVENGMAIMEGLQVGMQAGWNNVTSWLSGLNPSTTFGIGATVSGAGAYGNASSAGGGFNGQVIVNIDARGATDPQAVGVASEQGVLSALAQYTRAR